MSGRAREVALGVFGFACAAIGVVVPWTLYLGGA